MKKLSEGEERIKTITEMNKLFSLANKPISVNELKQDYIGVFENKQLKFFIAPKVESD
jgi:hypothetical protein